MELNFDKEIDAILRQARGAEVVPVFDAHPDADEISAFAENALPDRTRQRYTAHLAECTRCRKILSNLILLNSEAEEVATVAASSAVSEEIAEAKTPWYRKYFRFPQLVAVMGGLVILFSGFLGFLVLQNLTSGSKEVSYSSEKSAPQVQPTIFSGSESAPSNASTANRATTTNSGSVYPTNTATTTNSTTTTTANTASQSSNTTAISPPSVAQNEPDREDDKDLAKATRDTKPDSTVAGNATKEKKSERTEEVMRSPNDETIRPQATPAPRSQPVPKNARKPQTFAGETRTVGGKTFNNVGGTWYDSAYSSGPQISVKRGTSEYQKLDSGLRSIADQLRGTVVVVWKSKAYRIQ